MACAGRVSGPSLQRKDEDRAESLHCQDSGGPTITPNKQDRAYHHGDLRRALLDAALAIVDAEGVGALSMRAIAREAGVSHMAPYHHFADKAALIAAVAEEGFHALAQEMANRIAARGDDPKAALRESGIAYVVFAITRPHLFRVMFGAEVAGMSDDYPGLEEAGLATFAVLQGLVERSQDDGSVRHADSRGIGLTAWSLVHGLAMLIIDGHFGPDAMQPAGAEQLAYEVTGGVYRGLREGE